MPAGQLTSVLRYIRRFGDPEYSGRDDGSLLERFARHGDEAAFELLLRRHGPMVLGVCRRVLRDAHEAEDAFQATFLLLVRKAGSLRQPGLLGPWLCGVAYRVASRARARAARRRADARPVEDLPDPAPPDDLVWRDLRPVLDEAIDRLPSKYRLPFVLCYLEGMTNAQAAGRLGCAPGTVATRLSRARERLRARLARKGLALPAALLTAVLLDKAAHSTVPAALLGKALRAAGAFAAGGPVSGPVVALTEGVWRSMLMDRIRTWVVALAAVGTAGAGAGFLTYRAPAGEPPAKEATPAPGVVGNPADIPPPVPPPAPAAPVLLAPAREPAEARATYRTDNFRVEAPNRRIARLVGEAAERVRKEQAVLWLGREMPRWPRPCPIRITITLNGTGGATTFNFDGGQVKSQEMHLEGTLERILTSALPHEVTHTVFAHHFKAPVPRWADEGGAVLGEDEEEQKRHQELAREIVDNPGRAGPLRRLLPMKSFPPDVMVLYAEGYSVTRFLVDRKDRKTFLAFVRQGDRDGWDRAVRAHYGFRDVEALEDAWLAALRKSTEGRVPIRAAAPPAKGEAGDDPAPTGPAPVTVLAALDGQGRVLVRVQASVYYEPRKQPVIGEGGKRIGEATVYVPVTRWRWQHFDRDKVRAYDTEGNRVAAKRLAQLLRKKGPVLLSADGKKVDPFHLQLVKKDALILVLPPASGQPVVPPSAPTAPPAPVE